MAEWRNWAGNQSSRPAAVATPQTAEEVSAAVADAVRAGWGVKAIGAGHSFTAIGLTDGLLIDLHRLAGITFADRESGIVRVLAGTRLRDLNPVLWALGLALPNLGDIDSQTIAGAIATGTHGTGGSLPGIAAAVRALRIVTADGRQRWCSPSAEPDLFAAARVGLGALGVITEYELATLPAYLLRARETPAPRGAMSGRAMPRTLPPPWRGPGTSHPPSTLSPGSGESRWRARPFTRVMTRRPDAHRTPGHRNSTGRRGSSGARRRCMPPRRRPNALTRPGACGRPSRSRPPGCWMRGRAAAGCRRSHRIIGRFPNASYPSASLPRSRWGSSTRHTSMRCLGTRRPRGAAETPRRTRARGCARPSGGMAISSISPAGVRIAP